MIAPIREDEDLETRESLSAAHRLVAATLLDDSPRRADPVPHWQAWLFVAWIAVVTLAYAAHMVGWY
jgi:hypothetical protein